MSSVPDRTVSTLPTAEMPGSAAPAIEPMDEYNRILLGNARPGIWVNPRPSGRYNLVVIGAGAAGLVSAAGAAGLGARVAIVERSLMGGDCLNAGCVPSKSLLASARAASDARRAHEFGIRIGGPVTVDFGAVMERMRRLRARISANDSVRRFAELGVDVYFGQARFTATGEIEVGDRTLSFARAVIATGARAVVPSIPGLADSGFLTNESLFNLTELPPRLAVLGGGPIGCEMAQAFARFGSQVTLIETGKRLLARECPEASVLVQRSLERDGARCRFGARLVRVASGDTGRILELEGEGSFERLEADAILVGAGRAPNVEGMGLEEARVDFDTRTGIVVNDFLQTTNPRIFAAGDVCSKYKFTHMADALARIVVRNALFFGRARAGAIIVPRCTYTDPEVAHVGMSEEDAQAKGIPVETIRVEMSSVDRAILDGDEAGFLKVIHAKGRDRILGATLVSRHAGETISEISAAMAAGAGLATLSALVHPYPTQAEILRRAGDQWSRSRLTPRLKSLSKRFLSWRR